MIQRTLFYYTLNWIIRYNLIITWINPIIQTMMKFPLFTRVALKENMPQYNLCEGDVATIVEYHPVKNGEDGYSLEVFNAIGETIAVITVEESKIKSLKKNEVLSVRSLQPLLT